MNDNIIKFDKHHRKTKRLKKSISSKRQKQKHNYFLLALCLILGISLCFAWLEMKKSDVVDTPSGFNTYTKTTISGKTVYYEHDIEPPVKDDIWVMYQNLSPADKRVYDMFLDLVEHRNVVGYASSIIVSDSTDRDLGEDYFWNVFYAMHYDHPEYFYLIDSDPNIHAYSSTSAGLTTYVFEIDPISAEESAQITAFELASKAFMQDIDLSLSDEEIELQIHDKLIRIVTYDQELYEKHSDDYDLGYTAYGALVEDSSGNNNMAVCEGYALAFEYLLHQAGIPCAFVSGDAAQVESNDDDDRGHAWNVVKLGNKWDEVDTTWDDVDDSKLKEMPDAVLEEYENNDLLRFNICHHFYNKTTEEMEHLLATESTVINVDGYNPYNFRSDTSHTRYKNMDAENYKSFLNELVPVAE